MKIKDIIELGGKNKNKAVMTSRVMIATGDTKLSEFAGKLWDLIFNTNYLRASVHGVLVEGYTHQEASEVYGDKVSYLWNLVGLEGDRLKGDLGIDIYPYLIGDKKLESSSQIDALNSVVEGLLGDAEMLEETVFEKLSLDLSNKRAYRNSSLTDTEFIKFVRENDYLSKPKMEDQLNGLDEGDVGYITYLLRTKDEYLTEKDKTRKDILREVWWL